MEYLGQQLYKEKMEGAQKLRLKTKQVHFSTKYRIMDCRTSRD